MNGLDSTSYNVIRRFSDFVWLRGQLRDAFPYLIIPSLPEKQQIGRFNTDFVDVRHRALQRWVDRIARHPELTATGAYRESDPFPCPMEATNWIHRQMTHMLSSTHSAAAV